RRASSTPRPSSLGSLMSRKTMSGGSEVARVTASSPSVAISTRYPSSSSLSLYIWATAGSSSTKRTRTSSSSFFCTAVLKSCSTSKTPKTKFHRASHPGPHSSRSCLSHHKELAGEIVHLGNAIRQLNPNPPIHDGALEPRHAISRPGSRGSRGDDGSGPKQSSLTVATLQRGA